MSAIRAELEDWLQESVMAQAVTLQQAWQVQDLILQSFEEPALAPTDLWPAMERLQLFQMEQGDRLLQ